MLALKACSAVLLLHITFFSVKGQYNDSATAAAYACDTFSLRQSWKNADKKQKSHSVTWLAPAMMVLYGLSSIENRELKNINQEFKEEIYAEHPHNKVSIDNYLQFAPAIAVFGLNATGIKGCHDLRDRSMLYLLSNVIVNTTVASVKKISHERRPDGSDYASFPSGHTAEAFASATFMWEEYKEVSPWYGLAGYAVATATGYLRMYNNKHWFSDVVAGAGVGILSTRLAYLIYPAIQHKLRKSKPLRTLIIPSYHYGSFDLGLVHQF
ncbi:MAG: phosphatase PAP2 family protein [Ferruginibacter sp.]